MELLQKNMDSAVVLALIGEVEMTSSNKIRANVERLVAEGRKNIVVNLEKATGADSSGMGTLIACLTQLKKLGGSFTLCCMQIEIHNVMELANVLSFFEIYPTEEAALEAAASADVA